MTAILIAAGIGVLGGSIGGWAGARAHFKNKHATELAECREMCSAANVVEASADVSEATGEAVNAVPLAEVDLRQEIAASDVKSIGMQALVDRDASTRLIGALVAFDISVGGAQGEGDCGSYNCEENQQEVATALAAEGCPALDPEPAE